MEYTLGYCDKLMDQMLDKMGSDYFPLPIKLLQFRKATYDLIRETTVFLETTQEISDDIKPLVNEKYSTLVQMTQPNLWHCDEPDDYHRLISAEPFYPDPAYKNSKIPEEKKPLFKKYKKINIIKVGQKIAHDRDPYKKPTPEYPTVRRMGEKFRFDFGYDDGTEYSLAFLTYIREPNFGFEEFKSGKTAQLPAQQFVLTNIIVDLPPVTIQKIIGRTVNALRASSGDPSFPQNYQFEQTFGKRNK